MKLSIGKSNINFYAVHWLVKAVHKGKDVRDESFSVLTVTGGRGFVTDGRRMHIADDIGIEDGVYKILKNVKQEVILETCDVTPPCYDRGIPESGRLSEPLKIEADGWNKGTREGSVVLALSRGSPAELRFDLGFLLEALDVEESHCDTFRFQWTTEGRGRILVFEYSTFYGARKAVIAGVFDRC